MCKCKVYDCRDEQLKDSIYWKSAGPYVPKYTPTIIKDGSMHPLADVYLSWEECVKFIVDYRAKHGPGKYACTDFYQGNSYGVPDK